MPLSLFESMLFKEAPEDPPPEAPDTGPPDLPDDLPELTDEEPQGEAPPDLPSMDFEDPVADDPDTADGAEAEPLEVGDKISTVMNYSLYQRCLTLSNTINNQLETLKSSSDIVMAVSPAALEILEPLGKLRENIQLYLINNFLGSNYSRNLLFYNKCLNLLKQLNDIFGSEMNKGKKQAQATSI